MADFATPDLCIIGGGTAGLAAAEAARARGASVILIERAALGGEGLYSGGAAARALSASAARAHAMRTAAPFGVADAEAKVSFRQVHDHVQSVVARLSPEATAERLAALGVDIVAAEGAFLDSRTLKAGERLVRATTFLIATGSRTLVPDIAGLADVPFFTTETIFDNTRKLSHLVIVGEGHAALELAQAYRRLGSDVTVLSPAAALPDADPELSDLALRRLREEGVAIIEHAGISVQARSQGIGVVVRTGEREDRLDASHILVAGKRLPNLDGLGLEKARIRRDKADATRLELTPALRTSNPRVFAIGDAAGGRQFGHAASEQARLVVDHAVFGLPGAYHPEAIPLVAFTDPEIAEVGMTEAAAKARLKTRYRILRASFTESHRARADRCAHGLVKLVIASDGRILGAGIVGPGAGELIALFALAMAGKLSARDLATFVAPYPTYAEIANRLGRAYIKDDKPSPWLRRRAAFKRLLP
ncbi:mercuric reductase [Youhaiella tibetensis]|uniref:NAD(P)/FAD-dependent oxidoreductase n=1 Tax=Paradevosia tibetensis TaxID=1447062 RepID=A0A5B9DJU2_9HYPH|nr:NAD(P)/FAD-dependent oxidoreductase [Youhaiella tibetensis]QEE19165.1 NAD(P)/FAD-dependent oxidoreductase [Youhaiella tibetensis]GGF35688.1 mercuric reductase [Youhaiella tibetensis]